MRSMLQTKHTLINSLKYHLAKCVFEISTDIFRKLSFCETELRRALRTVEDQGPSYGQRRYHELEHRWNAMKPVSVVEFRKCHFRRFCRDPTLVEPEG